MGDDKHEHRRWTVGALLSLVHALAPLSGDRLIPFEPMLLQEWLNSWLKTPGEQPHSEPVQKLVNLVLGYPKRREQRSDVAR